MDQYGNYIPPNEAEFQPPQGPGYFEATGQHDSQQTNMYNQWQWDQWYQSNATQYSLMPQSSHQPSYGMAQPPNNNNSNNTAAVGMFSQMLADTGANTTTNGPSLIELAFMDAIEDKAEGAVAVDADTFLPQSPAAVEAEPVKAEPPAADSGYESPPATDLPAIGSFKEHVSRALMSAGHENVHVQEIYAYFIRKFKALDPDKSNWKDSIRHCLTTNPCFEKGPKVSGKRGGSWNIHSAYMDSFQRGNFNEKLPDIIEANHEKAASKDTRKTENNALQPMSAVPAQDCRPYTTANFTNVTDNTGGIFYSYSCKLDVQPNVRSFLDQWFVWGSSNPEEFQQRNRFACESILAQCGPQPFFFFKPQTKSKKDQRSG